MDPNTENTQPPQDPAVPANELGRRRLIRTGTLSAGVLLIAALLALVNYFGWKYHKRFDWTASRLYSLSETTRNVLAGLDRDVEAAVFLTPQDRQIYEPAQELLSRYEAASPRFKVRWIDPERNPVEAEQLARQYGVERAGIVLVSGSDRRAIDSAELAEFDFSGMQFGGEPQMTGFKGEQVITGALVQFTEGTKPKILFTTGHGEASLDDQEARGLSSVPEILGRDNFDLEEWASLGKAAVPAGTSLLVIAGPKASFVQPELDALSSYLANGGRVLVLADPVLGQAVNSGLVQTNLGPWLAGYGVRLGEDIVVDPSSALPGFGPETIFAKEFGDHPVTRPLQQTNLPVLLTLARSASPADQVPPAYQAASLLRTTAEGWGETGLADLGKVERDGADLAGPVSLAVVVTPRGEGSGGGPGGPGMEGLEGLEGMGGPPAAGQNQAPPQPDPAAPASPAAPAEKKGLRLVVFGDSDFATNQLLRANVGNGVLLGNILNWMVEREALIGIPPKKNEQTKLTLTGDQLLSMWLLTFLLPVLGAALGVFVHFRRRR
ncbi:MAG TPA: GldG family protein [Thermoanaerobaculia bacterium]|nr:GldG family protein [Thermoanaerobaculia bacterium]